MFQYLTLLLAVQSVFGVNLVEVLQRDGETKLIKYVTAAGLADAISSGVYTIFAPTNAAFDAVGTEQELLADIPTLKNILLYHVVKGVIPSIEAQNELLLDSMNGQKIRFNIYQHNKAVTIEGSRISKFDMGASNGVVHVIDKVMMPPTGDIVDLVAGNKDLSTLLAKVQQANLAGALKGQNLTVFAPTNQAFSSLPSRVVSRLATDNAFLAEILEYHVVPHTEYSVGLYNREYLRTIDRNKDVIRLSVSARGVSVNSYGHVIKADISASNGVVHVIDHVLVPLRYWGSFFGGFGK